MVKGNENHILQFSFYYILSYFIYSIERIFICSFKLKWFNWNLLFFSQKIFKFLYSFYNSDFIALIWNLYTLKYLNFFIYMQNFEWFSIFGKKNKTIFIKIFLHHFCVEFFSSNFYLFKELINNNFLWEILFSSLTYFSFS